MSYNSIRMYGERKGFSQRDKKVHFRGTTTNINMLERIAQDTPNEMSRRGLRGKIRELKKERAYVLYKR